jgi:hypothetical protein
MISNLKMMRGSSAELLSNVKLPLIFYYYILLSTPLLLHSHYSFTPFTLLFYSIHISLYSQVTLIKLHFQPISKPVAMPSPFHQKYSSQNHKVFGESTFVAMPEGPKQDADRRGSEASIGSNPSTADRRRVCLPPFLDHISLASDQS